MKPKLKYILIGSAFIVLSITYLLLSVFLWKKDIIIELIFSLLCMVLIGLLFFFFNRDRKREMDNIETRLNSSVADALNEGGIGALVYNEDYQIAWISSLLRENGFNNVGEKVLMAMPQLQNILSGSSRKEIVVVNDKKYQVSKKDNDYVLFFKDISREYDYEKKLKEGAYVLGFANFDNYEESTESEDNISYVNANIKIPVIEYFKKYGVAYRTLRNNRMQLILNQKIYRQIEEDRFSILSRIRNEAKHADLDITLSLAFAMGSEDIGELDDAAFSLIELCQTRGGDQIAVRQIGKEAVFYGGSSEAKENQSRVRARVTANTIRKQIIDSSNIIVCCHQNADADCIGAAICFSDICGVLGKESYIVLPQDDVEPMISEVLAGYENFYSRHNFCDKYQALDQLNDDSLVVMVDHHLKKQSNADIVLDEAKRLIIIDHHRRSADLDVQPNLVYLEAGASSTVELLVEFLSYLPRKITLSDEEANIMYLGLLIDTNHFRVRTGTRTFDAARVLRQMGADPILCDQYAQEPYEKVVMRNALINSATLYKKNILISCDDKKYPRSIASQAADALIAIKEIDAAMVICRSTDDQFIVSARSNGKINVQSIMERMNGGGHMSAAGLQRKEGDVVSLKAELINVLDEYFREGVVKNESNLIG